MDQLLSELVSVILAAAAAALAPLVVSVALQFLRRLNIELSEAHQAKLEFWARRGILIAEEWAAQRIKAQVGQVTSTQKLEKAIAAMLDKVPGITRDEAIEIIHAQLPTLGAGAAAALSDMRRAATNESR
jgi:hypothetical protein